MIVLGIETSCDETAVALVDSDRTILSNKVFSQIEVHAPYGGVVPEIAARSHMDALDYLIVEAMDEAGCEWTDIDAIAVTGGPGLIGGVIVGVMTAKALASVHQKPFVAVNHLEGHALTVRLTSESEVAFPYLLLLVSGGHCQILVVRGVGDYVQLGATLDDALGEAYDKVAKMLGLGYPGGPEVEKIARDGDPLRFSLPLPLADRKGCDFSFSGLKTAVRLQAENLLKAQGNIEHQDKADICASFQYTVGRVLEQRMNRAMSLFRDVYGGDVLVVAGGVAANQYLREVLRGLVSEHGMVMVAPPLKLCTDNAAMIAWAGIERLQLGEEDSLAFAPRARWPLYQESNVA